MPYDRSAFVTRTAIEGVCFDFATSAKDFIADWLFTPKPVAKASVKVTQADTSKLRIVETRKKTDAEVDLVDEQLFTINVDLEEHKLGAEVNPKDQRDADVRSMLSEARKARLVTEHLLRMRESLAATLATTVGNYPADLTSALAAADRWDQPDGDPEACKVTADNALIARCGKEANAVAMDVTTYNKLRTSPSFRTRTQYTNAGPVSDEAIKAYFKVEYLCVGRAQYDASNEGVAASVSGFWGTNVVFFYYNPSPALEDVSYGHMYLMNTPFWSKTTIDEKRNGPAGSMKRVEVGTEYKLGPGYVVGASDSDFAAGYLFRTVV